jgi:hypothetical protein
MLSAPWPWLAARPAREQELHELMDNDLNTPNASLGGSSSASEGYVWQPPPAPLANMPLAGPPSAPSPARRVSMRPLLALSVGLALALFIVAGVGAVLAYRFIYGHDDRATAAWAPPNAYAYIAVNTDPTSHAWLDAWDIAKRAGVDDDLSDLPTRLAHAAGHDPSLWTDLAKPVIGEEIGVAIWPGATGDSPNAAGIGKTNNPDKARELIPRLFDGQTLTNVTYRDVDYQVGTDGAAAGLVDGALVVASCQTAFEQVVDAHLGASLGASARFTTAAERAADNPLIFAWIDSSAIRQTAEQAAQGQLDIDPTLLAGYEQLDAGIVTVTLKADGDALRVSTLTEKTPGGVDLASTSAADASAAAAAAPATTLAFLASSDFYARVWQPAMAQLENVTSTLDDSGDTAASLDMGLGMLGGAFGVDLETDVIAHMRGPFAASVAVTWQDADYAAGLHFTTQLDDPAAVRAALDTVADTLADSGAPITRTSDGVSVSEGDGAFEVTVEDNLLRLTFDYLQPSEHGALADDATFQRALATLPDQAAWRGYLAVGALLDLVPADDWNSVDPQLRTALESIDAIAIATGADGAGTRTDVVLLFSGE